VELDSLSDVESSKENHLFDFHGHNEYNSHRKLHSSIDSHRIRINRNFVL